MAHENHGPFRVVVAPVDNAGNVLEHGCQDAPGRILRDAGMGWIHMWIHFESGSQEGLQGQIRPFTSGEEFLVG